MIETIVIIIIISLIIFLKRKRKTIEKEYYIPVPTQDFSPEESKLIEIINQHRTKNGLGILQPEKLLTELCEKHCLYMITEGKISHDYLAERFAESGAETMGENVCYNYQSPEAIFTAYKNSPTHYHNIIAPEKTHIGIATIQNYNAILFAKYKN